MLSPDFIRVRRRGDTLKLLSLEGTERERALELAEDILGVLRGAHGASEDEVREQLSGVPHEAVESKLLGGLVKVALDGCDFGAVSELEATVVRRLTFTEASRARAELLEGETFDRAAILAKVSSSLESTAETLESALFCDLKGASELRRAPGWKSAELIESYEIAALQGLFLAATEVDVEVQGQDAFQMRTLFQAIKFRELLFFVEELPPRGYRIRVSGPMSAFGPRTRYGLRLAQVVPKVLAMSGVRLRAKLSWGREKRPLDFTWDVVDREDTIPSAPEVSGLPTELEQLSRAPAFVQSGWSLAPADRIFSVPGVGVCIPDAVCQKQGRRDVHLELLGYWSREAVFKRIDWAAHLSEQPFIFLAPARLRVSEELMPETTDARLHLFKTSIVAKRLVEQLETLGLRC
jgi:uncharacterized protein